MVMISIDGLRPGHVFEAEKRGVPVPNLQRLMHEGSYATGVRVALPSVTYPNHTTLVTGVSPLPYRTWSMPLGGRWQASAGR
ncbi:MAG: type phosphodiesterase/nucleotide pyrophosphatase [Rhodospirillales bacterium]|nr:type phosphodiesterase/nucleotide pyrophosphatase [Rhodospirillales bacterium]